MKRDRRPRFRYYWKIGEVDNMGIPFYSMPTHNGVKDVSAQTLHKNGYPIPITPTYKTWLMEVKRRIRCKYCWASIRSLLDYKVHLKNVHYLGENHEEK